MALSLSLSLADTTSDFLSSPVVGPIVAGVTLALLAYIGASVRKVLKTSQRTEDHVLPYFAPPSNGNPDNTMPSRLKRVEHSQDEVKTDLSIERIKIKSDLDQQAELVRVTLEAQAVDVKNDLGVSATQIQAALDAHEVRDTERFDALGVKLDGLVSSADTDEGP